MADPTATLEKILATVPAEHLDTNVLAAGIAKVDPATLQVTLTYPYPGVSVGSRATEVIQTAAAAAGLSEVAVTVTSKIVAHTVQGGVEAIAGVRNVIAVSSAKGGVGKSMVAANLALALQAEGARAGLLDADIYGPSQPVLLGGDKAEVTATGLLLPHQRHGIQVLSMGHLVDPDQAIIWRGPMVVKALRQLLRETAWDDLDYLVLDLPPGTGDIQLSIAQSVPVTGALIVTTPQSLALADAVRGINMFAKVSIPVLGYVANMTSFKCPDCGTAHAIFGAGAGQQLATQHGIELLAELPLDSALGATATDGTPLLAAAPASELAQLFRVLASKAGAVVSQKSVDRSAAFPKIVPA